MNLAVALAILPLDFDVFWSMSTHRLFEPPPSPNLDEKSPVACNDSGHIRDEASRIRGVLMRARCASQRFSNVV
jgi:hypothetical protein